MNNGTSMISIGKFPPGRQEAKKTEFSFGKKIYIFFVVL